MIAGTVEVPDRMYEYTAKIEKHNHSADTVI